MSNGDIIASGRFLTVDNAVAPYLARLTTTCPATVAPSGAGCPGSGGGNSFEARNLPWIGSTFRARSTTIPSFAFVVVATGFNTTNLPLASFLPLSPPACNLLVTDDFTEWTVSNAGAVDTSLPIPNSVALAGLTLHQQLVLLEVDPSLAFLESTASNSIAITVGAF